MSANPQLYSTRNGADKEVGIPYHEMEKERNQSESRHLNIKTLNYLNNLAHLESPSSSNFDDVSRRLAGLSKISDLPGVDKVQSRIREQKEVIKKLEEENRLLREKHTSSISGNQSESRSSYEDHHEEVKKDAFTRAVEEKSPTSIDDDDDMDLGNVDEFQTRASVIEADSILESTLEGSIVIQNIPPPTNNVATRIPHDGRIGIKHLGSSPAHRKDNYQRFKKIEDNRDVVRREPRGGGMMFKVQAQAQNTKLRGLEIGGNAQIRDTKTTSKAAWQEWWEKKKSINDNFLAAAKLGKLLKVQAALRKGKYTDLSADIDTKDEDGNTAVHLAVAHNQIRILEYLIDRDVNIDGQNRQKRTPLHIACYKGYGEITHLLVEAGADLNLQDCDGNSALHFCAAFGNTELVTLLIKREADLKLRNSKKQTASEISKNRETRVIFLRYMKREDQTSGSSHKVPIHSAKIDNVRRLLERMFSSSTYTNSTPKRTSSKRKTEEKKVEITGTRETQQKLSNDRSGKSLGMRSDSSSLEGPGRKIGNKSSNTNSKGNATTDYSDSSLGGSSTDSLENNLQSTKLVASSSLSNSGSTPAIEEERIGPTSFIAHGLIGKGSFGEVYLVERKNSGTLFAMKVLPKNRIMGQNLIKYARTERNVLSITNHPFVVKLNSAFQTPEHLYLILDYCPGGDLGEHLQKQKRFSERRAKIYLAEVLLALEDLHSRDIIFRDLKPDNVVLDSDGHALLTDFGLSKEGVLDHQGARSFCGSVAYLAPEMLKRQGHGKAVDWYLLGVLLYEMLVGTPPYFTNNREKLFENIQRGVLKVPSSLSGEAIGLLKGLLIRNPLKRLGARGGAADIKAHPFFSGINWDEALQRRLNPPKPIPKEKLSQNINPKVFQPIEDEEKGEHHIRGWSFINTDDPSRE